MWLWWGANLIYTNTALLQRGTDSRRQQMATDKKLDKICTASLTFVSLPMLQIQQNLSFRRIPRTPGPDGLLSAPVRADSGAQCKDLQLNILEILEAVSQRIMHSLRSYPGTPSTFIDTWDSVEEGVRLHVTLKIKITTTRLSFPEWAEKQKYTSYVTGYSQPVIFSPQKPFEVNVVYFRALTPPKTDIYSVWAPTWATLLFCCIDRISFNLNGPIKCLPSTSWLELRPAQSNLHHRCAVLQRLWRCRARQIDRRCLLFDFPRSRRFPRARDAGTRAQIRV